MLRRISTANQASRHSFLEKTGFRRLLAWSKVIWKASLPELSAPEPLDVSRVGPPGRSDNVPIFPASWSTTGDTSIICVIPEIKAPLPTRRQCQCADPGRSGQEILQNHQNSSGEGDICHYSLNVVLSVTQLLLDVSLDRSFLGYIAGQRQISSQRTYLVWAPHHHIVGLGEMASMPHEAISNHRCHSRITPGGRYILVLLLNLQMGSSDDASAGYISATASVSGGPTAGRAQVEMLFCPPRARMRSTEA